MNRALAHWFIDGGLFLTAILGRAKPTEPNPIFVAITTISGT